MTNVSTATKDEAVSFETGMYETFAPSGPWLVTPHDVADASDLAVEMRVNGELRRRFSTAAMTWRIARLIASLSRTTLQAGDVIWCGAPDKHPDEPLVRLGDQVESSVERVGMIRNRVVR
jgi:2-keto-4-pentenoate hydratase/2-oxohepta-3-ene-1,7-dioic acid hydratase in catechol pathway